MAESRTNGTIQTTFIDDAQREQLNTLLKNYKTLRDLTNFSFYLAVAALALGILVILAGVVGYLFGLTTRGINITTVAGIVTECISGLALLLFRPLFDKLNDVSQQLQNTITKRSKLRWAIQFVQPGRVEGPNDIKKCEYEWRQVQGPKVCKIKGEVLYTFDNSWVFTLPALNFQDSDDIRLYITDSDDITWYTKPHSPFFNNIEASKHP